MCDISNNMEFDSTLLADDEVEFILKYRELSDDEKLKFTEYLFSLEIPDTNVNID